MIDLSNLTLTQRTALTKEYIITAILEGQTDTALEVNVAQGGRGPIRRVEVTRDRLTGKVLGRKYMDWTYYPTGEVATITISERDASDVETARRVIRHFADGRQPVVESMVKSV